MILRKLVALSFLLIPYLAFCQEVDWVNTDSLRAVQDSFLNVHYRLTRVDLNESDFEYIDEVVRDVQSFGCEYLLSSTKDRPVSNPIFRLLVLKLSELEICLEMFQENILLFKPQGLLYNEDNMECYPIYSESINNKEFNRLLVENILLKDFFCSCERLLDYRCGQNEFLTANFKVLKAYMKFENLGIEELRFSCSEYRPVTCEKENLKILNALFEIYDF